MAISHTVAKEVVIVNVSFLGVMIIVIVVDVIISR